jgi:hypothetical protein
MTIELKVVSRFKDMESKRFRLPKETFTVTEKRLKEIQENFKEQDYDPNKYIQVIATHKPVVTDDKLPARRSRTPRAK